MPNSQFKVDPQKYRERCAKDGALRVLRKAFKRKHRDYMNKVNRRKTQIRQQLIKESRRDRVRELLEEARQASLRAQREAARLTRYDMRIHPERYRNKNEEKNDTDKGQENGAVQNQV